MMPERRNRLLLIGFLFAVVLGMTFQVRSGVWTHPAFGVFSPLFGAVNFVTDGIRATWQDYLHVVGAETENRRLRLRIEKFDMERNRFREVLSENERLRVLLDLKERTPCASLAAEVIGGSPEDWSRTLLINRGSRHGLRMNMPVLGARGLVGRVFAVAPGSAKVMLITDVKSSVAVRFQRTREDAIMDGAGGPVCNLKYVHKDSPVSVGDAVITSGLDEVFPGGIPVGVVQSFRVMDYGIFQEVELAPAEGLNQVEEVLVVLSDSSCQFGTGGP